MRTEIITKTYLQFDELNDEQKEQVINNMRDINVDYDGWYDACREEFYTILSLLGYYDIESYFSGFWNQGDGASFKAKFEIPKNQKELKQRMTKLLEYSPLYFKGNTDIKRIYLTLNFQDERAEGESYLEIDQRGHYFHECTMYCDHEALQEFSRFLAGKYYDDLENCYYDLTSDEQVKESILANEYEFDLDTLELV